MKGRERGALARIVLSLIRSLLVLVGLVAVAGIILYFTEDPMAAARLVSLAVLIVSGGVSAFLNVRLEGRMLMPAIIAAVIITAALAIASIVASGGIAVHTLIGQLAYLALSILVALFAAREARHRRR